MPEQLTPHTEDQEKTPAQLEREAPAKNPEAQAEAAEGKVRAELARRWNNLKSTVDQLSSITRDIASEQITKLGLNKKDVASLPETQEFEEDLAELEKQKNAALAASEAEFKKRYGGWGTYEDGLRFLKPEEVTPEERETIATQVVEKLLDGPDYRILYHATDKKRFDVGARQLDTNRDLSLQAIKPLERYFSSSKGDMGEQPIAMRVIGKNPELLQKRTGEHGEFGIDRYKRLIRLPIRPETRTTERGIQYEVHTYALEDEIKALGADYLKHLDNAPQKYEIPVLAKKDEARVREYFDAIKDPSGADDLLARIQR